MEAASGLRRLGSVAIALALGTGLLTVTEWLALQPLRTRIAGATSVSQLFAALDTFHLVRRIFDAVAAGFAICALVAFVGCLYACRRTLDHGGHTSGFSPRWALYIWLVPGLDLLLPPLFVAQLFADSTVDTTDDTGGRGRSGRLVAVWWLAGLLCVGNAVYRAVGSAGVTGDGAAALVENSQRPDPELLSSVLRSIQRPAALIPDRAGLVLLVAALALHAMLVGSMVRRVAGVTTVSIGD